jgi:SAM-dependent methyltransferase
MSKISKLLGFARQHGVLSFMKCAYYHTADVCTDRYLNIATHGAIAREDLNLGTASQDAEEYAPVSYAHLRRVFRKIPLLPQQVSFIDYGCGKGRAIAVAAQLGYRKIVGIELSYLIEIANRNIDRLDRVRSKNIELLQCDAMDYIVPPDANVIYFFNPFYGRTLEKVVENIRASYQSNPRKIYIIYFNNQAFDRDIDYHHWLTKTYQSNFHYNISCGLYETIA